MFGYIPTIIIAISCAVFVLYLVIRNMSEQHSYQIRQLRIEIQLLKSEIISLLTKHPTSESIAAQQQDSIEISESEIISTAIESEPITIDPVNSADSNTSLTQEQEIDTNKHLDNKEIEPIQVNNLANEGEQILHSQAMSLDNATLVSENNSFSHQETKLEKQSIQSTLADEAEILYQNEWHINPEESEALKAESLSQPQNQETQLQHPTWFKTQFDRVKNWFFAGNWPVNIGILIFLIGIGALLRYLIQTGILDISISARLAGVGAVGVAGLFMGWRTRLSKPVFGLALQGGSVGVLLLVVFAASRLYEVMSVEIAFGLTVLILAASILMSLKQNALVLVAFAICAAYSAPLWLSTGSNNFIGLFSYYALINVAVVIMAVFRSWPLLNTIGYLFNAVVASLWAHYNYITDNFIIIQFFIALFFLFFTIIPIIYSKRIPLNLLFEDKKVNWVAIHSYLLMLITPGIVVIWEHRLFQMGLPLENIDPQLLLASIIWLIAAIQFALGYVQLKQPEHKEQGKIYYWLALGLATIAVPIAFSKDISGILFIAEGVMLYYIAAKALPKTIKNILIVLGLVLHSIAMMLIFESFTLTTLASFSIIEKRSLTDYLLTFSLALGMAISLHAINKQRITLSTQTPPSQLSHVIFNIYSSMAFILGLCSVTALVQYKLPVVHSVEIMALIFTSLTIVLYILTVKYWPSIKNAYSLTSFTFWSLFGYSIYTLFVQFDILDQSSSDSLPSKLTLINFILVPLGLGYLIILRSKYSSMVLPNKQKWHNISHGLNQTLFVLIISFVFYRAMIVLIDLLTLVNDEWLIAFILLPIAFMGYYLVLLTTKEKLKAFLPPKLMHTSLLIIWAGIAAICFYARLYSEGVNDPLVWIPLLNPVELPQLALGVGLLLSLRYFMMHIIYPKGMDDKLTKTMTASFYSIAGVAIFLFIQIVLIRMTYHWLLIEDIHWLSIDMFKRSQIQATLTLYWSVLAIAFWMYGAKKSNKSIWIIGAVLFGMALCKLLFIDRQHLGALPGIISFIVYGLFCVIIGYFLPLPKTNKANQSDTALQ
ncbi:DUF2339 domain-containing protein [Thorsellia anophelis]|uniref:Predicted membrane protein n=1 Tax=Thorsellia anophelis DSM 18579 TaxID=1123402 RepID=A0A1I0AGF0_9GAMM|nr:DUF2339 domain-containing protein [Thorsellia anophelis]SES93264.1 Predicted membrane protein [Thorsellia anophelis DSM 18579]